MMQKIKAWLYQTFQGCYGVDKLNLTILYADVALCFVNLFLRSGIISILVWALWLLSLFRMLSKNRYKRYLENRKYLQMIDRVKDRNNRYFKCPKCKQIVRVPRGKGKISITCPKCRERFIKKT